MSLFESDLYTQVLHTGHVFGNLRQQSVRLGPAPILLNEMPLGSSEIALVSENRPAESRLEGTCDAVYDRCLLSSLASQQKATLKKIEATLTSW